MDSAERSPLDWSQYDAQVCSVARVSEIVGDRWAVLVLREIFNGVRRFDDIAAHIGISRSVLAERLRKLERYQLVERRPYREEGDRERFEYRLSEMGRDLQTILIAFINFGDRWLTGPDGPPVAVVHRGCGAGVSARLLCDEGHVLAERHEVALEAGPGAVPRKSV